MKRHTDTLTRTAVFLLLLAGSGCGQSPGPSTPASAPPAATNGPPPKSTVSTVVDGITGKTAVDAGKRARIEIDRIGKQEQKDINDAMQP